MRCAKRWLRRKAGCERRYADPTYHGEHEDDDEHGGTTPQIRNLG